MIGVFDSGFGGLAVLNSFHKKLPSHSYYYFGDNKNAPYGSKDKLEIYNLSKRAIDFLFLKGCNLVIVACNTVSAEVLRDLQDDYFNKKYKNKKVLGIVVPNIENLEKVISRNSKLGIIGTAKTIDSQRYEKALKTSRPDIVILDKKTPELVKYIEKQDFNNHLLIANIKEISSYYNKNKINYLFLACTHYSFVKNIFKKYLDPQIKVIDSSEVILEKTVIYLSGHPEIQIKKEASTSIYTSSKIPNFNNYYKNLILDKKRIISF